MTAVKKRGRKTKDEYYQTKKIDNVDIDDVYTIQLHLSLEEYTRDMNIDRQVEILSSVPIPLTGYTRDKMEYGEILTSNSSKITPVDKKPVLSETIDCDQSGYIKTRDTYDLSLTDAYKKITNNNSDVACWWCCHQFDGDCVHLPIALKRDIYDVYGIFCSYSCCYTYMKDYQKYSKNMYLLNYMFRDQTGKRGVMLDHITPAPPREMLELFGGPLSISEFRNNSSTFVLNRYPVIYKQTSIEKITKTVAKKEEKVFKILPPSKKHNPTRVNIPNNSLSKILGISS